MIPTVSGIYEGTLRHRRFEVTPREFTHRMALAYIDLDELPALLGGRLVRRAPGLLRFRRRDYLGPAELPLADAVRDVAGDFGGPIRVLTQLRSFGTCFNPVSFYYCFDPTGRRVEAVVAEVENIPWGERHAYVLERGDREGKVLTAELEKTHHVSPLMGMEQTYSFCATEPGERLQVHIESRPREDRRGDPHCGDENSAVTGNTPACSTPKTFDATLSLRRRELSRPLMLGLLARYPAMSLQVVAKIYGQAARLKLKGARYYPHPEGAEVAR
jgi:DUF1365 family protein